MDLPNRDEIKRYLKRHGISRDDVALMCDVKKSRVDKWLSTTPIPEDKHYAIAQMMKGKEPAEELVNTINISLTDDQYSEVELAAGIVNVPVREFMIKAVIGRAREDMNRSTTQNLKPAEPQNVAHITQDRQEDNVIQYEFRIPAYLSAGFGSESDDSDEVVLTANKYPASYRGARVQGDSMDDGSPSAIPNGSIAVLNTSWSGKPFPSKGKVYAWHTEEGSKLKKFVRRKVDGKTQLFLESLNPVYPAIPYNENMKPQGEFVEVLPESV